MGLLANIAFYILSLYYNVRAYFYFRKSGGIKGLRDKDGNPIAEEYLLEKAERVAERGIIAADGAVNYAIGKDKEKEVRESIEF